MESSITRAANCVEKYRPVIGMADKSFKIGSYLGLLVLQFTTQGATGRIAQLASKLSSARFVYWGFFLFQDAAQLHKNYSEKVGSGVAKEGKQWFSFGLDVSILVFEISFVSSALLNLIPAARNIGSKVGLPLPHLILLISAGDIVQTWREQKSDTTSRCLTYGDAAAEIVCTSAEIFVGDGVVSATTGVISGACNFAGNFKRTWALAA